MVSVVNVGFRLPSVESVDIDGGVFTRNVSVLGLSIYSARSIVTGGSGDTGRHIDIAM